MKHTREREQFHHFWVLPHLGIRRTFALEKINGKLIISKSK
jgi:hypothetical protein